MKLVSANQRQFVSMMAIILVSMSACLFFGIRFILREEMDDNLRLARISIENDTSVWQNTSMQLIQGDIIFIHRLPGKSDPNYEAFRDTIMMSPLENEVEPFRVYAFHAIHDRDIHRVEILRKRVENLDLLITIAIWALAFPLLIFVIASFWNHRRVRRLWQPFFDILSRMQAFSISDKTLISPSPTGIEEFDQLQDELYSMQQKMRSDYSNLKHYTENASHELQTPIATALAHLESILQNTSSPEVLAEAQAAQSVIMRLSRLQQSLLLLSRIENHQYPEKQEVQLDEIIRRKLGIFEPLVAEMRIQLSLILKSETIQANKDLVDSLISNLLMNAIRHNLTGGFIDIDLRDKKFVISNSGPVPTKSTNELRRRFIKTNASSSSPGLGLAVVDEICNFYGWQFDYQYHDKKHQITVQFV